MKELLIWMLLAQGTDLTTTGIGLSRGCREVVYPWSRAPYHGMVVKGGATVALTFILPGLNKYKPKTAKTLAIIAALSGTGASIWNMNQIQRCQ